MRSDRRTLTAALIIFLCLLAPTTAHADPLPPFELDAAKLEDRMQRCISYAIPEAEVLMGWVNWSSGETRTWRCSSLRHMLFDDDIRPAHDPFVDIDSFMRCVDRVVSYGFPRPADPGKTGLIYQYNGTNDRAYVFVNDATGDIVTIYTEKSNDWQRCAQAL